jgi:hypothetical protein
MKINLCKKNLKNITYFQKKNIIFKEDFFFNLKKLFLDHLLIIKIVGKKYYPVEEKKLIRLFINK